MDSGSIVLENFAENNEMIMNKEKLKSRYKESKNS